MGGGGLKSDTLISWNILSKSSLRDESLHCINFSVAIQIRIRKENNFASSDPDPN